MSVFSLEGDSETRTPCSSVICESHDIVAVVANVKENKLKTVFSSFTHHP